MPEERETFVIELPCQPSTGCGITIVGSRSSGIAIKSLLPGGVADLDGRLKIGDKLIYVDGRRAGLMTCAQVAQYLRKQKRVSLEVERPDYELLKSTAYNRNSRKSNANLIPHSYTFSTISDLQTDLDYDAQTLSTDLDSPPIGLTPSPTASCSDLVRCSPRITDRNGRITQMTSLSSASALTVPSTSNHRSAFNFYYSGFDKLRKFMNIFPKSSKEEINEIELTSPNKYRSLLNSNSLSSNASIGADSCVDSDVFRADSSEDLISPGGM